MRYQLPVTSCQLPVTDHRLPITDYRSPITNYCLPFFLLLVILATSSWAQVTQPARYEKEQKSSFRDFTVISMGEQGIALIRDKQKYEHGENLWETILLDSGLNETWTKDLAVDNRYHLIGHDYRDQNLYFLFRMGETDQGKLKVIKIDGRLHQTEEHNYEPELVIRPTHFNIMENQVIFAGYVTNEPTVLLFNLDTDQAKLVPGLILSNSELLDVRVNINNTFNVLLSERQSKSKKKLIAKTFDKSGAMLLDDVIEVEPDKTILSAFTSTLVRDELMIIGTWGEGVMKQAAGIFTVLVDPYNEQKINFYDFAQFKHFLDYLSPKRAAKTKEKSDRRRALGKIPEYKTYILPARLEETKEGFLFYAEAYYSSASLNNNRWGPSYPYSNYPYASPYGFNYPYRFYNSPYNYGYPYGGTFNSNTHETKMLHGSLSAFDAKGNLVADHGFKLEEIKIPSAEQVSDFIYTANKSTIVFNKEKELHTQVSQADGVSLINEKLPIQLKSPTETIRSEDGNTSGVRFWHKNFLYLYGYQTIKNPENGNRDVFYINKLKVD
jgi:hypothetical protein